MKKRRRNRDKLYKNKKKILKNNFKNIVQRARKITIEMKMLQKNFKNKKEEKTIYKNFKYNHWNKKNKH